MGRIDRFLMIFTPNLSSIGEIGTIFKMLAPHMYQKRKAIGKVGVAECFKPPTF